MRFILTNTQIGNITSKASLLLIDQALISISNMATMVGLARGMSSVGFGSFALLYSVMISANVFQSGLVIQPYSILGGRRSGAEYVCYTTSTAISQLVLSFTFVGLVLLAWLLLRSSNWDYSYAVPYLAPALLAWQLQEFVRRVLYVEGRIWTMLLNDIISYGGQVGLLTIVLLNLELTTPIVLGVIALTSASAAGLGMWQLRASLTGPLSLAVIRENWHFGKWLAGSDVLGDLLYEQVFVYIAAAVVGVTAAGVIKAVCTVFGPVRALATIITMVLLVHFTRVLAAGGTSRLYHKLSTAYGIILPILSGCCIIVIGFASRLLQLLYGSKYMDHTATLRLYTIYVVIGIMALIPCCALKAMGRSRSYFIIRIVVGVVGLPVGWALIVYFGATGIILSMILVMAMFTVSITILLYAVSGHTLNQPAQPVPYIVSQVA